MAELQQQNLERIFLSALVYNRTGVLLRVASLFARRGYNVISLTVAETENPLYSRITIVSDVEPYKFMQVEQQLKKLGDVIRVVKLNEGQLIASELLLIKVHATNSRRTAVLKTINGFGAKVKDIGHTTITAELTGLPSLIDRFIEKMTKHGIIELSRSGLTALETGDTNINEIEE
ncbi:MAG TPA: acetolactate synthase small subunit [Candidatus Fimenecus excrementigallinarum]|uniref:Acetolactate synthase small subunit n=1 Tax=Candidatus Fimenecus excrementigallinarum TaxID=2840816 RepID=A0A9D1IHR5_9FIRM|nr:acetolactate synthase small subunit [Candidatus Fimenecus excrementigallinarum]